MTRPAELLARLNPTVMSFGMGSGGIPELTRQDIAAALGMVKGNDIGRILLEVLHWDPRLPGVLEALQAMAMTLVRERMLERHEAEFAAEYRALMGDKAAAHDLDRIRGDAWPKDPDVQRRIVQMVVCELATPNACWACCGRGHATIEARLHQCPECEGKGALEVTDAKRARFMGWSKQRWADDRKGRAMHRWLLGEFRARAEAAESALGRRMRR